MRFNQNEGSQTTELIATLEKALKRRGIVVDRNATDSSPDLVHSSPARLKILVSSALAPLFRNRREVVVDVAGHSLCCQALPHGPSGPARLAKGGWLRVVAEFERHSLISSQDVKPPDQMERFYNRLYCTEQKKKEKRRLALLQLQLRKLNCLIEEKFIATFPSRPTPLWSETITIKFIDEHLPQKFTPDPEILSLWKEQPDFQMVVNGITHTVQRLEAISIISGDEISRCHFSLVAKQTNYQSPIYGTPAHRVESQAGQR